MAVATDFEVFEKYKNAGGHAFARGVVSENDKDRYSSVFEHLVRSAQQAISLAGDEGLQAWNCRFARNGGIQGQRPLDLWASIINADSAAFSKFPQIYVIASDTGVEIGFSVSIHEDDYFNQELKRKNRSIIPILNRKLPAPDGPVASLISDALAADPAWKFGEKTRQGSHSSFSSFGDLLRFMKSSASSPKGGGAVYKILEFDEVMQTEGRLRDELFYTLNLFRPVMNLLKPTADEEAVIDTLKTLADFSESIPEFDPNDEADGRCKVLRAVAVRQGQAKFREALVEAYGGKCAVTGCELAPTLQAAHISPYNGVATNKVANGILLRADIHTLFDLGLLRIAPYTLEVLVSSDLIGTDYEQYHGRKIHCPAKGIHQPSNSALEKKIGMFPIS